MTRNGQKLGLGVVLSVLSTLLPGSVTSASSGRVSWPDLSRPAERQEGGAQDAAVVIGLFDYLELPDVPGASQNAREWEQYLVTTRRMRPSSVELLLDGAARLERIQAAVVRAARRVGPEGTLWFVFVGHGAPAADGSEGVLVTYDAGRQPDVLYARSLPQSTILAALGKGRQARTVVVLDACFNGQASGTGTELAAGLQPVVPLAAPPIAPAGTLVLTAGRADQFAGPLPGSGRPAFSYLLLGALRGWADQSEWSGDRDGHVTGAEALAYTREALAALRTRTGRDQDPQSLGDDTLVLAAGAREAGPDLLALRRASSAPAGPGAVAPRRVEELGTIRAEVGFLRVEGTPHGAQVVLIGPAGFGVGGRLETRLPYGPTQVPAGAYEVRISAPGHDAVSRRVTILADRTQRVLAELVPSEGTLIIAGEPEGARVELTCDGGFTKIFGLPGRLTVPRGSCRVVVTRGGYTRFERRFTVTGGETSTVDARLEKVAARGDERQATTRGWVRLEPGTFQMG